MQATVFANDRQRLAGPEDQPLSMQVGSLAMAVNSKSSFLRGSERSLRLAVGLLTKTFLQNLQRLRDQPDFPHLWNRILQVCISCMYSAPPCCRASR